MFRNAALPLSLFAAFAAAPVDAQTPATPPDPRTAPGHPSDAPKTDVPDAPVPDATPMPQPVPARAGRTMQEVLDASTPSDWRPLDPLNTLYLELDSGRVVIELAPQFAPKHVGNIRALARGRWWDGLSINRVH